MKIKKIFAGILTAAVAASSMIIPSSAADSYTASLLISDSQSIGQYWGVGGSGNTIDSCVTNATVTGDGKYTVSLDVSGGFSKDGSSYTDMKDLDVLSVSIAGAGAKWNEAKITIDSVTVNGASVAVSGATSRIDANNNLRVDLFNDVATPKVSCINGNVGSFSKLSVSFTLSGTKAEDEPVTTTAAPAQTDADGTTAATQGSAPTGVADVSGIILLGAFALCGALASRKKND